MALGTYNNNEDKGIYRPNVYGYAMTNPESEIDKTKLAYAMWQNTMKISIAPKIEGGNSEYPEWEKKNIAAIYLNHTKARIFATILRAFLKDPKTYSQQGVWAGQGLMIISNGEEFEKKDTPCLVIMKIGENGKVESSYAYEFKRGYHSAIANFNQENGEYDTISEPFNNIEIEQMITQLESYYEAMTGCVAFSVVDNLAYTHHRLNEDLAKIASGVGVQLRDGQKSSKGSYFANGGNKNASSNNRTSSTIDDIMGEED
jgi:hypothetical protein